MHFVTLCLQPMGNLVSMPGLTSFSIVFVCRDTLAPFQGHYSLVYRNLRVFDSKMSWKQ